MPIFQTSSSNNRALFNCISYCSWYIATAHLPIHNNNNERIVVRYLFHWRFFLLLCLFVLLVHLYSMRKLLVFFFSALFRPKIMRIHDKNQFCFSYRKLYMVSQSSVATTIIICQLKLFVFQSHIYFNSIKIFHQVSFSFSFFFLYVYLRRRHPVWPSVSFNKIIYVLVETILNKCTTNNLFHFFFVSFV